MQNLETLKTKYKKLKETMITIEDKETIFRIN